MDKSKGIGKNWCQSLLVLSLSSMQMACEVTELGTEYKITDLQAVPPNDEPQAIQPDSGTGDSTGTIPGDESDEGANTDQRDTVDGDGTEPIKLKVVLTDSLFQEGSTIPVTAILPQSLDEKVELAWTVLPVLDPAAPSDKVDVSTDFVVESGTVSIDIGSKSARIMLEAINDFSPEGQEPFTIKFSDPALGVEGASSFRLSDGKEYLKGVAAAGYEHACAIRSASLACWGTNAEGELGIGSDTISARPTSVPFFGEKVKYVDSQRYHTCAIKDDALFCWGRNDTGQIGDGSHLRKRSPTPVVEMSNGVEVVAAGFEHTCAIRQGSAKCWGGNDSGEIGNGTVVSQDAPAQVSTLAEGVTDIAVGNGHSCAIKAGTLYCWGRNDVGQLGNGTTNPSSVPVMVKDMDSGVTQVTAHGLQTCAIKAKALYCWGNNDSLQVGNGGTADRYETPQLISSPDVPVTGVALGREHGCAISAGVPNCWGRGAEGQLGNGFVNNLSAPAPIATPYGKPVGLGVGAYHSCMVTLDGVLCWGRGTDGQLGDGLRTTAVQPVGVRYRRASD
jgi:alpha-tubulin suppressor-like RCC1 family protein